MLTARNVNWFHHPDISLPVVGRRAAESLLETLAILGPMTLQTGLYVRGGWRGGESRHAYWAAVRRLEHKGLIALRRTGGRTPVLRLTPRGTAHLEARADPRRRWNARWNGRWYLLAYDVPERERAYRTVLRSFLRRLRLGYLQNSVWVTPFDIRPAFSDLCEAAAVDNYAFLFESRTVLGLPAVRIVEEAWDLEGVRNLHRWYLEQASHYVEDLRRGSVAGHAAATLAESDMQCYAAVMENDPLLPRALWPPGYLGPDVVDVHTRLQRAAHAAAAT